MMLACPARSDRRLRDAADVRALFAVLAEGTQERCGFAFLDPEWRLLGTRETPPGSAHAVGVPVRDVIADALRLEASGVVMVHNHPGGDPAPSPADLAVTRRLMTALDAIDVRLIDHVVLGGGGYASMRAMGLL